MSYGTYFAAHGCDLDAFAALTAQTAQPADMPLASGFEKNIPVYDGADIRTGLAGPKRQEVLSEWAWVLGAGPGVLAIKSAYANTDVIDACSEIFFAIIEDEKQSGQGDGDHFAKAGANARIWNVVQKLCMKDPAVFARYFGNPILSAVSEAWLGEGFQMTAQVNLVRPGGAAQDAHRDYHLGFATADAVERAPAHVHLMSAALTLQGAIAHCDMPIESGPTKLLPFSQAYDPGYVAYRRPEFRAFFEENYVQLPLSKGDMLFFNPALFHAAGENRSTAIERLANLVQVSSPYGRAMETLDRAAMVRHLYPHLLSLHKQGDMTRDEVHAAIACSAEGYAFPTNLDTDPPLGGRAPKTPADLMRQGIDDGLDPAEFGAMIHALYARKAP